MDTATCHVTTDGKYYRQNSRHTDRYIQQDHRIDTKNVRWSAV